MNTHSTATDATEAEQYQHIGAYLREMREHFRLSPQDVARRLHIRHKYLVALEEGNINDLPGRVYTIGYLQTYAEFLGLDATKILEDYQEIKALDARETFRVMEPHHHHGAPAARLLIGVAAVLVMMFLAWQFFSAQDESVPEPVVEAVPDHLIDTTDAPLLMNERNRLCLTEGYQPLFPPCYGAELEHPPVPFALKPYGHAMEIGAGTRE